MSERARVVWSEGMFLRTQHFQQQDRWVEGLVRGTLQGIRGHGWGVRALELDTGLLAQGKIGLRRCEGILPDGTLFAIPETTPHPEPLPLAAGTADTLVHLELPVVQAGAVEIDPQGRAASGARFAAREIEVRDSIAGAEGLATVEVGEPRFRLAARGEADRSAWAGLAIARVVGAEADGGLVLDPGFVPPCLAVAASPVVTGFLEELAGKLASIADERAAYVAGKRLQGAGDIADFLILMLCNRAEPMARHLAEQKTVHPEDLHGWLLGLLGEASSFAGAELRPALLPPYRHDRPDLAFRPLFQELRRLLVELARPDRKAIRIPLKVYASGVRAAEVQDRALFATATFVIACSAPASPEAIRQRLPGQIKIGPAEDLQSIVRAAVPGIPIRHLPTVPREIPLHRGMTYFELDRDNDYWRKLATSAGLAFHVTGDLREGMEMECWAIRD
jgi:type VI secretion system protein ImpJ